MTDPFKEAEATRKVLTAPEDAEGRIDAWLAATLAGDFSRSRIKALIPSGASSPSQTATSASMLASISGWPMAGPSRRASAFAAATAPGAQFR